MTEIADDAFLEKAAKLIEKFVLMKRILFGLILQECEKLARNDSIQFLKQ